MTRKQAAAMVEASTVLALFDLEGMKAANLQAHLDGKPLPYTSNQFVESLEHWTPIIGKEAVIDLYRQCTD